MLGLGVQRMIAKDVSFKELARREKIGHCERIDSSAWGEQRMGGAVRSRTSFLIHNISGEMRYAHGVRIGTRFRDIMNLSCICWL